MIPPRIERLTVANYRALRSIDLKDLTPLTVFIGPNGSGKSTLFDVFAFLSECFSVGLRQAWDKRGRFRELRSRDADGPITIEIKYRESPLSRLITYRLEIDETSAGPTIKYEMLRWKRGSYGQPFRFLEFWNGSGIAATGDLPDEVDERETFELRSPDLLAVNTLGQFSVHPRVAALREFIASWHLSYLSASDTRGTPEAGPQEHLSRTGDNLANVIQYLKERHSRVLEAIVDTLVERIPQLEGIEAEMLTDGRLLLQIKDAPFERPVLAKFASDGTLKLLSYLVMLHDPSPPRLIGIEEPENFLHPFLLYQLAEECDQATARTQLMVTTHSPYILNALRPKQVRLMYRAEDGYSRTAHIKDIVGVDEFFAEGAKVGDLWMESHLTPPYG